MKKSEPIISICIPTFNRSVILERTLNSIFGQIGNDERIEIIVSDNCSSDDTEKLGLDFAQRYPSFKYFRNPKNIGFDENVRLCVSYATGIAIKPLNDYANMCDGSVLFLIQVVLDNLKELPSIFFLNGLQKLQSDVVDINSLNAFIGLTSYWSCWLSGGLIWKVDWCSLSESEIQYFVGKDFFHFELYLFIAARKEKLRVYNNILFINQQVVNKGGYNFFKVFSINYLSILRNYHYCGCLCYDTFSMEKERLFKSHLFPYFIELKIKKRFNFETDGAMSFILSSYSKGELFSYTLKLFYSAIKKRLKRLVTYANDIL